MEYNTEIKNESALPIPYMVRFGQDRQTVASLHTDKPLFVQMSFITITAFGQLAINCTSMEYVFACEPGLLIKPVTQSK